MPKEKSSKLSKEFSKHTTQRPAIQGEYPYDRIGSTQFRQAYFDREEGGRQFWVQQKFMVEGKVEWRTIPSVQLEEYPKDVEGRPDVS